MTRQTSGERDKCTYISAYRMSHSKPLLFWPFSFLYRVESKSTFLFTVEEASTVEEAHYEIRIIFKELFVHCHQFVAKRWYKALLLFMAPDGLGSNSSSVTLDEQFNSSVSLHVKWGH